MNCINHLPSQLYPLLIYDVVHFFATPFKARAWSFWTSKSSMFIFHRVKFFPWNFSILNLVKPLVIVETPSHRKLCANKFCSLCNAILCLTLTLDLLRALIWKWPSWINENECFYYSIDMIFFCLNYFIIP